MEYEEELETEVHVMTSSHGLVDYHTAKEAYDRVSHGVATRADIRLGVNLLRILFGKDGG